MHVTRRNEAKFGTLPRYARTKLLLPGNPGMPLVRVTPILFSAIVWHGLISFSVTGQSIRLAPLMAP